MGRLAYDLHRIGVPRDGWSSKFFNKREGCYPKSDGVLETHKSPNTHRPRGLIHK